MSIPKQDQFVGCILGLAVGDAVGAPVEIQDGEACQEYIRDHVYPKNFEGVVREYEGPFAFGQYTDDTQFTRALLTALLHASNCRVDPDLFVRELLALYTSSLFVGGGRTTKGALKRLKAGYPWVISCSNPRSASNGAAMRVAPVALACWDKPLCMVEDSVKQGLVTHSNPIALAAAVAVSATIVQALTSTTTPKSDRWWSRVSEITDMVPHRIQTPRGSRTLGSLVCSLYEASSLAPQGVLAWINSLMPKSDPFWKGISPWAPATVLWSLYAFMTSPEDYWRAIGIAIWPGGDVDTTAAITGAVAGAYNGVDQIPDEVLFKLNDQGGDGVSALSNLASTLYHRVVSGVH